jgi:FRG domain.
MKEICISSIHEYVEYLESLPYKQELWFRGVPNELYLPTPGLIWKNAVEDEGALEHYFLVKYKNYSDNHALNSWELMALMQHHGLPTRLLDWSASALVALYFALSSEPSSEAERVVWALDPFSLNKSVIGNRTIYCPAIEENRIIKSNMHNEPIDLDSYLSPNLKKATTPALPEKPIAIHATHCIKRISSQQGCFTIHGSSLDSIDKYLTNDDDFHMIRLKIQNDSCRQKMLATLSRMGVDEEFIYQDLDSLCGKIYQVWKNS